MLRLNFKNLSLLLTILSSAGAVAQTPVWTQFSNAPGGTSPRFDDVSFVNETNGWVARATGGIHRTTDGGKSFTLSRASTTAYPGTNLTAHFRSIVFASESRGWAGNLGPGSYDGSVTDTNILFETFDGGTNWTVKPGFPETGMKGLCAMYALDSQHIYGGGRVRGPAHFIKSTDGGTNWSVTNLTAGGILGGIMDVYFKDANNGFLVGMDTNTYATGCASPYSGAIARTTNGGVSWDVVAASGLNCAYFWKMSWPSPNVGYASLQQNGSMIGGNHIFYKTTDGGATWASNGVPFSDIGVTTFYSQGIGFVSETEGWVGGSSASGADNFLHTTDGGASWTPVGSADTLRINRIRFLRPDYAVASGARVAVYRVPLAITSPPTNQTVPAGSNAVFTVAATGSTALGYQWRFNGDNLTGANSSSHTITNAQAANSGAYDVVVTDISGSITSAVATLTLTGVPDAPAIATQPQSRVVYLGSNATFSVMATGTPPLIYQWHFEGNPIQGATNVSFTLTNAQFHNQGAYTARITNSAGNVTSAAATLTLIPGVLMFRDDFDSYDSPVVVTDVVITNGYKLAFRSAASLLDFTAIFGFDYSTVTYPTSIPPAPNSTGATTKGLFLTVNKDATAAAAAVNLYPVGQSFSGDYALKFDLWINWANLDTSTEHALFGINHSGNVTNRITQSPSDGLFFAVEGEDDSLPTSPTLRDYSVFRGGGAGAPILMITNNTTFGPAPLLSPQFENYNPGFVALFPSQTFPGYGTTPNGTAGLRWLRGEVSQKNTLITWRLNDTIIAQYTNAYAYTNGDILIGYNDHFSSIGDSNNFAIFDNIRVETVVAAPVKLLSPALTGDEFSFSFITEPYESYTVEWTTNLTAHDWITYTNITGNGGIYEIVAPVPASSPALFFRVRQP